MSNQHKFSGTWKLFEDPREYQGNLIYDDEKHLLALELIIPSTEDQPMPHASYKGKIPYVNGRLTNNQKVVLYDCVVGHENIHVCQFTRQLVHAQFCFWGLEVSSTDDLRFSQISFDLGDIVEWSGLCRYQTDLEDESQPIKWIKEEPIEFPLEEGVKVRFSAYQNSIMFESYSVKTTIEQHVKISLEYTDTTAWDSIMSDLLCVRYMISLGMSCFVGIEKIHYYHPFINEVFSDGQKERIIERASDVWLGTGDKTRTSQIHRYEYNFSLEELKQINGFQKWTSFYPKLKPILDLYFAAHTHSISTPEMYFLNLMQALETYHARFVTDNLRDYITLVDKEVDELCQGEANAQWKDFLADKGQRRPGCNTLYLKSRLAYLIFAKASMPFWVRGYSIGDITSKLVITRNYYTHYDPQKEKDALLNVRYGHLYIK